MCYAGWNRFGWVNISPRIHTHNSQQVIAVATAWGMNIRTRVETQGWGETRRSSSILTSIRLPSAPLQTRKEPATLQIDYYATRPVARGRDLAGDNAHAHFSGWFDPVYMCVYSLVVADYTPRAIHVFDLLEGIVIWTLYKTIYTFA